VAVDAALLDAALDPASDRVEVAVVSVVDAPDCFDAATVRCIVEFVRAEPAAVVRTSATVAATVVVVEPMLPSAKTVPHMLASRISAVAPTRRRSTCVRRRLARSTRAASRA
jgi:hypothetical protein